MIAIQHEFHFDLEMRIHRPSEKEEENMKETHQAQEIFPSKIPSLFPPLQQTFLLHLLCFHLLLHLHSSSSTFVLVLVLVLLFLFLLLLKSKKISGEI